MRVSLVGASGRMGLAVQDCARRHPGAFALVGMPGRGDDWAAAFASCDAVIDFSLPEATDPLIGAIIAAKKPLVVGTTGHGEEARDRLAQAAKTVPLLLAANFSVGVNALFWLTRKAAEILGPDFDLEVIETHHRQKKDAPSGTARRLVEILAEIRRLNLERDLRHGRAGNAGPRSAEEIGVHSVRGGDVVGEHTVLFAGAGERVELTHRAASRETFAAGALRAAAWLAKQKPGRIYDMEDVLGLR
ncbi:4-hydroxy-tetrahydrodipicolinate reductase [Verrucomicrobia bacterium SCGC AG-212-E04]|nr:4-hydroxy-tetrahydrodipicolinate reductase [Verrucomicrobia bacterium SCGC AG-212-E04]